VYDQFASRENPYCHLLEFKLYPEGHRYISCPANLDFQPAPAAALALKYMSANIHAHGGPGAVRRNLKGVNRSNAKNWSFDANIIFPNVQLGISDGTYMAANEGNYFTQHLWPISVDETLWEMRQYLPRSRSVAVRIAQQNLQAAVRDVIREDLSTLENTQTVLRSGAISHMQLNDNEIAVRHSYYKVDEFINAPD
jgi:phenylpropionate dioxygenase-like ring-hydroxylating dioxygenase large terminal subunit